MGKIILLLAVAFLIWKRGELCSAAGRILYARGKPAWRTWYALGEKLGGMSFASRNLYAYLLLKEGEIDEANKKFALLSMERLTKPQRIQLKSAYALVFWKRGEVAQAIEMLEEVVAEAPATTTYGSLGYMYVHNGNLSRALEFNQEAYDYNSTNAIIVDNLALTYYKAGEHTRAREVYEELMALNPTFPEAYFGYGRLLIEQGEEQKGVEMLKKALDSSFSFLSMVTREEILDYLSRYDTEAPPDQQG